MSSQETSGFYGFRVGDLKLYALYDGWLSQDRAAGFVVNATEEEVRQAFADIGLPAGKLTMSFTTLLIDAGDERILVDTGMGTSGPDTTGKTAENLAAAGYDVSDIDTILISHFHRDHIGGLLHQDGTARYPNAKVLVPRVEWDYWMSETSAKAAEPRLAHIFSAAVKLFGSPPFSVSTFEWDSNIRPFVKAIRADGHTPGHTAFEVSSSGEHLLVLGDVTNHPSIFARCPHWVAASDVDRERVISTRIKLFDKVSADKTRLHIFHAPFPALGFVHKTENGYDYFPELWQSE